MKIITNHHKRDLVYGYFLPDNVLADEFEYARDTSLFFKYRESWYCLDDFMMSGAPEGWDALACDSFFSGVVVKLCPDWDQIVVGLVLA